MESLSAGLTGSGRLSSLIKLPKKRKHYLRKKHSEVVFLCREKLKSAV